MRLSLALGKVVYAVSTLAALGSLARRRTTRARLDASSFTRDRESIEKGGSSEYSLNWAGAIITAPDGETINAASGRFRVPTPTARTTGDGTWGATIWVGIDGYDEAGVVLQGGADVQIDIDGDVVMTSFHAWYEWFPGHSIDFEDFDISAGDEFSVSITSSSSTQGDIAIENLTTGQFVSQSLKSSTALFGRNAEWIVEAPMDNGVEIPLVNFGTVYFTDCVAKTDSSTLDLNGAVDAKMTDDEGDVIADAFFLNHSSVEIKYV